MMSCAGVMYQPYSTATPLASYLAPAPAPAPAPASTPTTSPTTSPSAAAAPAAVYHNPDQLAPLTLKRELTEKAYKVEREGGEAVSRLLPPGPGHLEAFSPGRQHSSAGSCGTPDPRTPVTPRPASQQTERESDGEDELHRSAQYLARNVILYTHYVGEVSRIVDEHFSKALDQTTYNEHKVTPMASRNLPPSFFNAHYHAQVKAAYPEYSPEGGAGGVAGPGYPGLHPLAAHHAAASPDPWQYAAQAGANSPYHRSVQDLYSSSQSRLQSQYSSLFLQNPATAATAASAAAQAAATSRLHAQVAATAGATVKSEVPWSGSGEYHTPGPAHSGDFSHHLDRTYSPHPYTNMPSTGLEAASQDSVKDLYWPSF